MPGGTFNIYYRAITQGWVGENSLINVIMNHRISQNGSTVHAYACRRSGDWQPPPREDGVAMSIIAVRTQLDRTSEYE